MNKQKLIKAIKKMRENRGITYEQIYAQTGVNKANLSKIFNGERIASLESLIDIARACGMPKKKIAQVVFYSRGGK